MTRACHDHSHSRKLRNRGVNFAVHDFVFRMVSLAVGQPAKCEDSNAAPSMSFVLDLAGLCG